MYFDELYHWLFVQTTLVLARVSRAFDTVVVDGIVNGAAWAVGRLSRLAGLHDQYVVDGAVNGAADLAQGIGAAARAPQTGRIRLYVTILMFALSLALAGAIVLMLLV
jgi:hypothetical protein